MRRSGVWLVVIAALGGIALSGISLHHYVNINTVGLIGAGASFCNISEAFNCDVVSASSYASIFGFPNAGFGLIFFVLQAIFGLWAGCQREPERGAGTIGFFMALCGLIPAGYLLYIMLSVLQTICLTCLGTDVAMLLVLIGWGASGAVSVGMIRQRKQWFRPLVIVVVVAVVGGLFLGNLQASIFKNRRKPTPAMIQEALGAFQKQTPVAVQVALEGRPVWGNPDAKVQIVEFSDFQCPFCQLAAFQVRPYLAEFRRDIALTFLQYPLSNECNDQVEHAMHPVACLAARAALCAQDAGNFWEYHDDIFRNQKKISKKLLLRLAKQHGFDQAVFTACLDDPKIDARVRSDTALGKQFNISGTPAIFVNGRPLGGWRSPEFLRAVIQAEINR